MEGWQEWKKHLGSFCKIIYHDGLMNEDNSPHYSKREGEVIDINPTHLFILCQGKKEGFLITSILRIEMMGGQQ